MEPLRRRHLNRDVISTCLKALRNLQATTSGRSGSLPECGCQTHLSEAERRALGTLTEWLADEEGREAKEDNLVEPERAYLLSYRDTFRRSMRPNGQGQVVGDSPKAPIGRVGGDSELQDELEQLDNWNGFDIFKVAELSRGRPLEAVVIALFNRFDLINKLKIPHEKLFSFLKEVERGYKANPYHNSMHAADVTQSLGCMFASDAFTAQLTDLEMVSMIIGAAVHDLGHPGVTNEYLINVSADHALTYNDNSVNENWHVASAFRILRVPKNNFLEHLPEEEYRFVRRMIILIVLGTDMASHKELLTEFAAAMQLMGTDFLVWPAEKRGLILKMCVHCADISNPSKPLDLSRQWAKRVMQEFFDQGDNERLAGISVSPLCDRENVDIPKTQLTFLEYVVRPSYECLASLAPNVAHLALSNVATAKQFWQTQLNKVLE